MSTEVDDSKMYIYDERVKDELGGPSGQIELDGVKYETYEVPSNFVDRMKDEKEVYPIDAYSIIKKRGGGVKHVRDYEVMLKVFSDKIHIPEQYNFINMPSEKRTSIEEVIFLFYSSMVSNKPTGDIINKNNERIELIDVRDGAKGEHGTNETKEEIDGHKHYVKRLDSDSRQFVPIREVNAYKLCKFLNLDYVEETKFDPQWNSFQKKIGPEFMQTSQIYLQRRKRGRDNLFDHGKCYSNVLNDLRVFSFILGGYDCNYENTFVKVEHGNIVKIKMIDNEHAFANIFFDVLEKSDIPCKVCMTLPTFYSKEMETKINEWTTHTFIQKLRNEFQDLLHPIELEALIIRMLFVKEDCENKSRAIPPLGP